MLMTTPMPVNGGNMFPMPLLHGTTPGVWDLSMSSSSEKTFSNMPGVMMSGTSIAASNTSLPMIYYPGLNAFGAVGGGGGNANPVVGPMSPQTIPPPTAKETEGSNLSSSPSGAAVGTTNNAMYFVPVSPSPSNPGEGGGARNATQPNSGLYNDANAPTTEMSPFLMPPMYPFVGNSNTDNGVSSYPTSLPTMPSSGLPVYLPGQQQVPVFHSNYVMLSDGRIMTAFH
ncbi:unnamed protein product [Phytomonas sp. Hart1]|nr:unnamed protein product [Phytomonas sp. Hart1]|eukprot:CCW67188.1 unnamed protein product [Phytomonas sp. isolate Hart1]